MMIMMIITIIIEAKNVPLSYFSGFTCIISFNPYIPYEVGSVFPSILHIRQVASPLTLSITICKIRTKK